MAWIYLAESEALASPLNPGLEPSPIVSATDTRKAFYFHEWQRVTFIELPSGTMLQRSPLSNWAVSISSLEDSPARTLALLALERAWAASDPVYSSKLSDSLASFDHDSFSWRTCQLSLFGGSTEFSWSSLRWGTTRAGQLFQPQRLEPRTFENAGSYLPTPTASVAGTNGKQWCEKTQTWINGKLSLNSMASQGKWPTPCARDHRGAGRSRMERTGQKNGENLAQVIGGQLNPTWVEWLMGFPSEWTASSAWAMQWFLSKPVQLSNDLSASPKGVA